MTRDPPEPLSRSFAFGPFTLIPDRPLLLRGTVPIRVGSRALHMLTALIERPGDVVTKRELLAHGWPGAHVEENNLKANMVMLRRALGEAPDGKPYIATVTGRGYRFVAPVRASGFGPHAHAASADASATNNLPPRTTRIFGRAETIETISRDLLNCRLVSIVGTGGIGKTTVALAVAERMTGAFENGVWFVDLGPLKDPSRVPNAIAAAIGLATHSVNMLAALRVYLRDRGVLLVLDNCEHLIDEVASCVDALLTETIGVKCLATSREPLQLTGERIRRLGGLAAPPASPTLAAADALTFPAVQLLVAHVDDDMETFPLSDAEAAGAGEICRRLDGLPLAIELAATRVERFGVQGWLERFDDRYLTQTGRRDSLERHRTLSAMIDWSYDLLTKSEASLLRQFAVFPGPFDLDSACAVAREAPHRSQVVDDLVTLVTRSLVVSEIDADSASYRLLGTTRDYCLGRLRQGGEEPIARLRHAEYICSVLEKASAEWTHRPARDWGHAYGRYLDDLRAALDWLGGDAIAPSLLIRLSVAGSLLWNHFSLTEECRVRLSNAVNTLTAAGLVGSALEMQLRLSLAGAILFTRGPEPEAMDALGRALEIADRLGAADHQLRCLRMIASYQLFNGEHDVATQTLETFMSTAKSDDYSAARSGETHLACADLFLGQLARGRRRLERFHGQYFDDPNAPRFARFLYDGNVDVGNVLSHILWLMGLPDTAMQIAEATVQFARKAEHDLSLSNALAFACFTSFASGRDQDCARYVAMLDDEITRQGIIVWRPFVVFYRGALAIARNDSPEGGIELLARAIAEFRALRHFARLPFHLGVLAAALAKSGRLTEAATTIESAIERARVQGELWCLPEVMRIQASILVAQGRLDDAEADLVEAIAIADETRALSWRLRAANELASLWRGRSRDVEARAMLRPIFDEFTEGFETGDLIVAADLLASPALAARA